MYITTRSFVLIAALGVATPAAAQAPGWQCGFLDHLQSMHESRPSDRPEADQHVDSELYPIRVHYLDGDESLVDAMLEAAELSWEVEVEQWGWDPPGDDGGGGGSDALDYYLADTEYGGYAAPEDWWSDGDHVRCTGYVVVNRLMDSDSVRSTTPHEFNHILQIWTDCVEDPQLLESSATYAMDHVYDFGSAWYFAGYYQDGYYRGLDYYDYAEPPQYGSFIFLQYIAERFGDGTPASTWELWEGSAQGDWDNSNHWMLTLEDWLADHWAENLPEPGADELYTELAWQEFGEWRYFLGGDADGGHWAHGDFDSTYWGLELDEIGTASKASLEQGPVAIDLPFAMAELSAGVVLIRYPDEEWTIEASFTPDGGSDRWALTTLALDDAGAVIDRTVGAISSDQITIRADVAAGTETMVLVLADVGDGDLDPRSDDWGGTDGVVTVGVVGITGDDDDDTTGDDDDALDDDVGGGCDCSAAPTPHPAPVAGLVLLSAALLRRRRGA